MNMRMPRAGRGLAALGLVVLGFGACATETTSIPFDREAPTTPTNVAVASASADRVDLTWSASADDVGVTGYRIRRDGVEVGVTASESFSDTGLTPSTSYDYTVSAFDAAGNESAPSAVLSVSTAAAPDTEAPSVPTGLSGTAVSTSAIDLTWLASSDNVGVTGYRVRRDGVEVGVTASESFSDTGLTPSTSYDYTVSAFDAAGNESAPSAVESVSTLAAPDTEAPSVPTGLSGTAVSTSAIDLTWSASSDNVGVTGYRVRRDGVEVGVTASESFSDTGLTPSTSYDYTVSAFDAAGNESAPSAVESVSTSTAPDTEAPSVPTGLSGTAVSTSAIDLTWSASSDNVGVTGYRVRRDGVEVGVTASESFSDTGLTPSTSYDYTVSAFDAAGNESAPSAVESVSTPSALGGVGILGDSNVDEYRADDNRGGAFASVTFGIAEIAEVARGFDFGSWGTRSEPRRSGYAYNWARSGATGSSMIASGQHTGLAQQIGSGLVSTAIVFIGTNDFSIPSGVYGSIYDGSLSGTALQNKIDDFVADVTTGVDALLDAGVSRMVVVSVPDEGLQPGVMVQFPDASRRALVTAALDQVNGAISTLATARSIAYADLEDFWAALLPQIDAQGRLDVGGELINVVQRGNDPRFLQLDDGFGHPGTIASGLMLNFLVIERLNSFYGLSIQPLSDAELLQIAGIS